jgi:hypothetical protein
LSLMSDAYLTHIGNLIFAHFVVWMNLSRVF